MNATLPPELFPIGTVESTLSDPEMAAPQRDLGAPEAWLAIDERFVAGLADVVAGDELIVLSWLDRADRGVLSVHPRGDVDRPQRGVFSTRSPHRPNPIGLHRVRVTAVRGNRIGVDDLEAVNGTPILDIKPVLDPQER